ncbi:DEAD/DEAH box helicase [Candidatus Gracilibacteria bacterium]|nr:MAG: DEAD/DEAH box helicase [Candidatus Gracilibacteria bacterium]
MFGYVIPFGKSFDEFGFTYEIPKNFEKDIKIGQIVKIFLGEKETFGVIYEIFENIPEKIEKSKIKKIEEITNQKSFINGYRIELLKFISKNYFSPIHNSLNLFLPKNLVEKVKKGKLKEKIKEYKYFSEKKNSLTTAQQSLFKEIIKEENKKILLFGVTGSGKTEIYIKLLEKYLKEGKQSLLLIPEIVLTNQIASRLENFFGKNLIILNSTVSEAKKTEYFLDIASGNAKIVIGTRSALFYPFSDLGIIIIDEEHDNSYISDQTPRYNAIEIANKISDLNGCKLLLASGTPSVNSMYKAINGDYKLLNLFEKFKK